MEGGAPAAAEAAADTERRRKGWLGMRRKEERRRNLVQSAWVLPPGVWVGGWVGRGGGIDRFDTTGLTLAAGGGGGG